MYLSKKISTEITDVLVDHNFIKDTERNIYNYCYNHFLEQLFYATLILLIAITFKKGLIAIIFLSLFYPMRGIGGGYHASSEQSCTIISLIVASFILFIAPKLALSATTFWIVCYILCSIIFLLLVPVEHKNKRFSNDQKKTMKKRAVFLITIYSTVFTALYITKRQIYYGTFSICVILIVFSMLLGFLKFRRDMHDAKNSNLR